MLIKTLLTFVVFFHLSNELYSQNIETNYTQKIDSIKFQEIQKKLDGCWKTKYYQFKYNSIDNFGSEYKSLVHSSAPFFKLELKDKKVFFCWTELTGGNNNYMLLSFKDDQFQLLNSDSTITIFNKNKDCSPMLK